MFKKIDGKNSHADVTSNMLQSIKYDGLPNHKFVLQALLAITWALSKVMINHDSEIWIMKMKFSLKS